MDITNKNVKSLEEALRGDPSLNSVQAHQQIKQGITLIECNGGKGTGLLLTTDGFILTDHHVIARGLNARDKTGSVNAVFPSGVRYPIHLENCLFSEELDTALVKADIPLFSQPLKYKIRLDGPAKFGEEIMLYAIDAQVNPPELVGASGKVRHCFEEEPSRAGSSFLTTNYAQKGFSGGSIVSKEGELLGILTRHVYEEYLTEVHVVSTKITSILNFYRAQLKLVK